MNYRVMPSSGAALFVRIADPFAPVPQAEEGAGVKPKTSSADRKMYVRGKPYRLWQIEPQIG